jgi:hypothetical protein
MIVVMQNIMYAIGVPVLNVSYHKDTPGCIVALGMILRLSGLRMSV